MRIIVEHGGIENQINKKKRKCNLGGRFGEFGGFRAWGLGIADADRFTSGSGYRFKGWGPKVSMGT